MYNKSSPKRRLNPRLGELCCGANIRVSNHSALLLLNDQLLHSFSHAITRYTHHRSFSQDSLEELPTAYERAIPTQRSITDM